MRASRLLSLLMTLQARGRISASALAGELGVSVRTIYRDVDELSQTGVPVVAERGASGGFQLLDGWRTRLTGLTLPEARALFLVGLPGPARELGLGEAMASAQLKLLAALPADWQVGANRVGARFHLDPVSWYRVPRRPDHLPIVAQAVWTERRLAFTYQSWKKLGRRVVDPLGLVLKGGDWYLVARASRPEPLTFKVANILEANTSAEGFTRPPGFDLAAFWAASVRRFEDGLKQQTALLRFSPKGLSLALETSTSLSQAVQAACPTVRKRAWVTLAIRFEKDALTAPDLLRLGAEVEVLGPAALRDELRRTSLALHELYRPGGRVRKRPAPRRRRTPPRA